MNKMNNTNGHKGKHKMEEGACSHLSVMSPLKEYFQKSKFVDHQFSAPS